MPALHLQEPVALVLRRGLNLEVAEVRQHFVLHRLVELVPTEKDRSSHVRAPRRYFVRVIPFETVDRTHAVEEMLHWTS